MTQRSLVAGQQVWLPVKRTLDVVTHPTSFAAKYVTRRTCTHTAATDDHLSYDLVARAAKPQRDFRYFGALSHPRERGANRAARR